MGGILPFESILRFISALIAFIIARTAWQRARAPGSRAFAGLVTAAGVWSFFTALEYMTQELSWRIFWSKLEYLGITSLPQLWLLFTLQYSRRGVDQLRQAMRTAWPYIIPVGSLLLVFTNEYHHLIWSEVTAVPGPAGLEFAFGHGPAFYVLVIYTYVLLLAGSLALIVEATRFPKLYKRHGRALLLAVALPWVANFMYISRLSPWPNTDLTAVAFVLSGVVIAIGVYRFYLFDVVPVAQDSVIESLPDGVIVIDDHGRVAYSNSAARRLLQMLAGPSGVVLPEEWTGKRVATLLEPFPTLLEVAEGAPNSPREMVVPGTPMHTLEVALSEVRGPRGESNANLLTLREITERKRTEERARLQSAALQSAANAIVITDKTGAIQYVNPSFTRITGYSSEEVLGKNPRLLKSGRHETDFYQDLWKTINSNQPWHGELINRRKDGTLYTEDQTIAPVRNAAGEVTHFIGIKQDITQRKVLEETRDDLMKSLVHDLRNPLNSILLSLEMFQMLPETDAIPQPVRTMLQLARDATWRMMGMVNAIMDMSRLESGQLTLEQQPVILSELVEQAINQQSSLATHSDILLLNAVPYDLPHAYVDAVLATRLFQNLLDNAIKFTPSGGQVEIKARLADEPDRLLVSVQDSGPGIPAEMLPRMFEKYATGQLPRRGTGLGLAFCRLVVEAHGGRIWVESPAGEGATFKFSLPVLADH